MAVCVHGTYEKNLESILAFGLKRMNRLHVHFSYINVLIFLNIKKPLESIIYNKIYFYISDNKVILTESIDSVVPVDYFQKIESWPNRLSVHF
ncbi:unnamed protein product [Brassica rapa]|uniref:Uncharacterized protein n=1 Tax=Brassica campestris TaxID=3711 RepID=A0A3P6AA38_BRACM|nr:unnamed protein product [Brassica rapa]VDC89202.1 unnamed protein product [Brassica rapa]